MEDKVVSLSTAFGLNKGQLIALTGGGGKTSLMMALSEELAGGVVVTATTRLALEQTEQVQEVIWLYDGDSSNQTGQSSKTVPIPGTLELENQVSAALEKTKRCLVVGQRQGDKVGGVPVDLPGKFMTMANVSFVLVEADGSRNRPCKAPASHEPVIPEDATIVIPMAGIDALDRPMNEVSHRPDLVSSLTGLNQYDIMTPQALARLLAHPDGGLKGAPEQARIIPFINKVDSDSRLIQARSVARQLLQENRVEKVILGAVHSDRPFREAHRRVTAVVLAAGESKRMGRSKQLLPWGDTTVLGQIIRNLQRSAVNEIIVVSGSNAGAIEAEAAQHGIETIRNEFYASGGMISSLQTALRQLPDNRAAVLVMLADQPMVESTTIDALLLAYWEYRGELLAPVFSGKRGNPVLFGRSYIRELLALADRRAPREIIRRHKQDLTLVQVESDSVLHDIDRQDDYERWRPRD
jgi:molybdenum cofactor cytidylyltransferase